MNWKSIFTIRGTNYWILAMGIVANLLWSFFALVIAFMFLLDAGEENVSLTYVGLMISEFVGPLLIGWFCGWLAFDDRGATYGVIGAFGSVLMILLTLLASGWIVILLSFVALAGGFNGGVLSRYRGKRK